MTRRTTFESFIGCCFALCLLALSGPSLANLFVSSYLDGTVREFTPSGSPVGTFAAGSAGLHFGPDGNLYAASQDGIKVYDGVTGAYLRDFSTVGALDFAFDAAGNVYAVDNVHVLKYDTGGALLATYSDGVSTPQGIIISPQGHLLVTNAYDGSYRNTITDLDPSDGSFTTFATGLGEPIGIAAGPDGRYYVANYTFANNYGGTNPDTIQVVAADGGVSATWNQGGSLNGASYLAFAGDRLFVTSYYNNTVQIFDAATGASLGAFDTVSGGPQGIAVTPIPEPSIWILWAIGICVVVPWGARRTAAAGRPTVAE